MFSGSDEKSKVKNRTSFRPDQILQPEPKGQRQVNTKPQARGHERNVDEKYPHATGAHAKLVGQTRRGIEAMLLEKIFQVQYKRHGLTFRLLDTKLAKINVVRYGFTASNTKVHRHARRTTLRGD